MLKLPSPSIQISPNRQRREFDEGKLLELKNSIESTGLMQPIVVRSMGKAGFQLVAGERRLRAIANLRFLGKVLRFDGEEVREDLVPCVLLGELDELAAEEAELDENIRRVDLTWQERAAAVARLSNLRQRQAVVAQQSGDFPAAQAAEKRATVAAIAEEVRGSSEGSNQEWTRREIILAKHMDNPEVAKAKGVDEAWKVLKRAEQVRQNVALAATVGRTFSSKQHTLLHEDSLAWMKSYAGELFDVILTDPPYGMGADQFGDSGGKAAGGAHTYDDSYATWQQTIPVFAELSFRVTKPQAHLYAFCDFDRFHELKGHLEDVGWECFRTPLVWINHNKARTPWVDFGPQRKYEICLYAKKGRKLVTKIFPDIMVYPSDDNLGFQAQKPVGLFIDLLRRSVAPGDTVLDPFAGTGPIFAAATELKVKATGIEKGDNQYAIAVKRLEKLSAQGELSLTDLSGLK